MFMLIKSNITHGLSQKFNSTIWTKQFHQQAKNCMGWMDVLCSFNVSVVEFK